MKKISTAASVFLLVGAALFVAVKTNNSVSSENRKKIVETFQITDGKEREEKEASGKRWEYEWKMLHDPATGKIPRDAYQKEKLLLREIQQKQSRSGFRTTVNNTYNLAGPSKNGGRTRAVAFDMRNNQIMLAGGVSGGLFRSTNGGTTWTYVNPANESRIISCLAQDPRPGFQDTWYAGTGELFGPSPLYPNAFIPGFGVMKSTDNGATWTRLTSTSAGASSSFDNLWDIVFNIQVDANGHVYAAILNTIRRSTDGGASWTNVLASTANPNSGDIEGLATDIVVSKTGSKYYAAFSGRNGDANAAGVWQSTNGTSWSRIAGAPVGSPTGFVSGWRTYNNATNVNGQYTGGWGKTILAIAPSNPNILYVMYNNAFIADLDFLAEADLFRADLSGPSPVWSANRNNNLKALQNGATEVLMELQGGYNMLLAVHPTNPDLVLAGGVNLFRSTNAFASQGTFIGGDESSTYSDPDFASHVDFHSFAFDPSNVNRVVIGSDGGMAVCNNITITVQWNLFNDSYQTLQYYHVAIDPTAGSRVFAGGAQDNSTTYLDTKGLLGAALPDPNDHYVGLIGGDGGMTALGPSTTSQFLYGSVQEGICVRVLIGPSPSLAVINPDDAIEPGEFVTYFHLDNDNTNILYYVAYNNIWRTTSASTVTSSSGWTPMTGLGSTITGSIFALATSRGTYNPASSYLYIGTSDGEIYRLNNPRDAAANAIPVDITPPTLSGLVREIAVHPTNPDIVLAVVSNYNVSSAFWTNNATSASPTWQVVEGNIPTPSYRSCAIVATNSGTEYYVGTSIGLFSTTNINGASTVWTLEGPSVLQGAIISDLVLRTSDNTLLVGTHGNGMFVANIGNVATPVPNIITNDKTFISSVTETVTRNSIYFQRGTQTGINKINVQVLSTNGQVVYRRDMPYSTGSVDVSNLSPGVYILDIWSDNKKFRHTQKFVKAQ